MSFKNVLIFSSYKFPEFILRLFLDILPAWCCCKREFSLFCFHNVFYCGNICIKFGLPLLVSQ